MRVRSLRLKNFRGFVDEVLDLDRLLTVLVGTNGAGKTSVLDALPVVASHLVAGWTNDPSRARSFTIRDLRHGAEELSVHVDAELFGQTCLIEATPHADPARGTEVRVTPRTGRRVYGPRPTGSRDHADGDRHNGRRNAGGLTPWAHLCL